MKTTQQPKEVLQKIVDAVGKVYQEKGRSAAIEKAYTYKQVEDEYCPMCECLSPSLLHECLICGNPTTTPPKEVLHTQQWEIFNEAQIKCGGKAKAHAINKDVAELIVKSVNEHQDLKDSLVATNAAMEIIAGERNTLRQSNKELREAFQKIHNLLEEGETVSNLQNLIEETLNNTK